jgi:lipopolysaccharide transport system permease protein
MKTVLDSNDVKLYRDNIRSQETSGDPEERVRNGSLVLIKPPQQWVPIDINELWEYRELFCLLVWREIRTRYAQTLGGVAWAVAKPVSITMVFSVIWGQLAGIRSDGLPYPIFVYSALLPWQLFTHTLSGASNSLVANQHLLTKAYFPRLVIPLAATATGVLDFFLASIILLGLIGYYQVSLVWSAWLTPLFVLLAMVTALGMGLWLSALNVRYRDVGHGLPFLMQLWLFITPVVYPVSLVPEIWRPWMGLNPMTSVVEGIRWALFGVEYHYGMMFGLSSLVAMMTLVSGLYYFCRTEQWFADVV